MTALADIAGVSTIPLLVAVVVLAVVALLAAVLGAKAGRGSTPLTVVLLAAGAGALLLVSGVVGVARETDLFGGRPDRTVALVPNLLSVPKLTDPALTPIFEPIQQEARTSIRAAAEEEGIDPDELTIDTAFYGGEELVFFVLGVEGPVDAGAFEIADLGLENDGSTIVATDDDVDPGELGGNAACATLRPPDGPGDGSMDGLVCVVADRSSLVLFIDFRNTPLSDADVLVPALRGVIVTEGSGDED